MSGFRPRDLWTVNHWNSTDWWCYCFIAVLEGGTNDLVRVNFSEVVLETDEENVASHSSSSRRLTLLRKVSRFN